jgi:CheY-like chemotaxis protein
MPRILVVEDEPQLALGLEDDLKLEGYEVEVARDGQTATERALSQPFDLVILDVMLPRKDGFEVCRELRGAGLRGPIILLTAKTQESDKVLGLDLGADDYVTKPFSPRELRARIRTILRQRGDTRSQHSYLEQEISLAAAVQQRLFPRLSPRLATLDYVGFCQPARGMSGDYFDFLDLAPGRLGLVVGDVSGKGISAAFLTAFLHASIRTHAPLLGNCCGQVVAKVNALLYEATEAERFATLFYAVYKTGRGCSRTRTRGTNRLCCFGGRRLAG